MSMIILLKYYIKVVWFFKYNFGEQFRKNTVFLLAKGSVLWYNKYRTKKEKRQWSTLKLHRMQTAIFTLLWRNNNGKN